MERFIETLTALIMQYEEKIQPGLKHSPAGVLKYLMEEHRVRQIDLVPILEASRTSARSCPVTDRSVKRPHKSSQPSFT